MDIKLNKDTYLPSDNILLYIAYTHNSIKEKVRLQKKQNKDMIIDLTDGKKILSAVFLKDGHIILLNTSVDTLFTRANPDSMKQKR